MRRGAIVALLVKRSSRSAKNFCGASDQVARRSERSGASRPGGLCRSTSPGSSESVSSSMTSPPSRTAPPLMKRRASPLVLAKPARVMRSTIQISSRLRQLGPRRTRPAPRGERRHRRSARPRLRQSPRGTYGPWSGRARASARPARRRASGLSSRERVVVRHQVVGDAHDLPEHLARWIRDADVVADGLAHLHGAVGADEERGGEDALGSLAVVLHHVAPHEQVVELVRAAELDVGVDCDRVVGLHERVEELG